ncbi:MAG: VOC family protein [Candidatus Melainabacteria bacterium HGW-Melainabacteria-1]|nr:MAG: VOC family protein [Candidatus Melainabacteria bacterium HGW-Melainabacteria-1]
MAKLNPYLNLKGKCREAMGFYKEIFGGELSLMTFADSPMAAQVPAEMQDNIVHAFLDGDVKLMGTDMEGGPEGISYGNTIVLCLNCDSVDELQTLFSHLATDGQVEMAPKKEFWGGTFAALSDQYGIKWMLEHSEPQPETKAA